LSQSTVEAAPAAAVFWFLEDLKFYDETGVGVRAPTPLAFYFFCPSRLKSCFP